MGIRVRYTGGPTKRRQATEVPGRELDSDFHFTKGEVVDLHPLEARRLLRDRPEEFERVMPHEEGYTAAPKRSATRRPFEETIPVIDAKPPITDPDDEFEDIVVTREEAKKLMALFPGDVVSMSERT